MATETLAPPPTLNDLNLVIRHDLTPDPSWEETGEFHRDTAGNRFPVYREKVPIEKRVPQRDADGGIMYHLAADGSRRRQMWTREVTSHKVREFVYAPVGNGICQKNYHFRPSAEETIRRANEIAEQNAISDLGRALKESGQSFVDLLAGVKSAVGIEPREKATAPPPPDYPRMYAPGRWYLNAAHEVAVQAGHAEPFVGKKDEAKAATWPTPPLPEPEV